MIDKRLIPSLVESPSPRRPLLSTRERRLLAVALLLAVAAISCSPPPEPRPMPARVCEWPAPSCSSTPPSLGVYTHAERRAERWGR